MLLITREKVHLKHTRVLCFSIISFLHFHLLYMILGIGWSDFIIETNITKPTYYSKTRGKCDNFFFFGNYLALNVYTPLWIKYITVLPANLFMQFMVLLVLRHTLPIIITGGGEYSVTLFTVSLPARFLFWKEDESDVQAIM